MARFILGRLSVEKGMDGGYTSKNQGKYFREGFS